MNLLEEIVGAFRDRIEIGDIRNRMIERGYPAEKIAKAEALAERQDAKIGDLVRLWEDTLEPPPVSRLNAEIVSGKHMIAPEEIVSRFIATRDGLKDAPLEACAVVEAAFRPILEFGDCYGEH